MDNYLARFIPRLSDKCEPLRKLTVKNNGQARESSQQAAFESIKSSIASATALQYYGTTKPVTLQTDASSFCLGTVLFQEEMPVAYSSRSLSVTEQDYAQIG